MNTRQTKEIFEYHSGITLPPVHPGRTLAAELQARDTTAAALALRLRVHPNRLTEIVRGHRSISPETALRLGRFFGMNPAFWSNLQAQYDLAVAQREMGETITKEVEVA